MSARHALLAFLTWVGLAAAAHAQGRVNGEAGGRATYAPVELRVACGAPSPASCALVLARLAAWTGQTGIDLKPGENESARDAVRTVCQGLVAAAIVPRDAAAVGSRADACAGRYDVIGRPLFPLYAFLLVRPEAPFRRFADLAGKTVVPAAAGQALFDQLTRADPAWRATIPATRSDPPAADGYFTVQALDGDMTGRVRLATDARGRSLYKFIDIDAAADLFRLGDGSGHCVYRRAALDFGGPAPVATVSVDMVMVLGRGFRDVHARGGPAAAYALDGAIGHAQAAILAGTQSPRDWRPAAASCR